MKQMRRLMHYSAYVWSNALPEVDGGDAYDDNCGDAVAVVEVIMA